MSWNLSFANQYAQLNHCIDFSIFSSEKLLFQYMQSFANLYRTSICLSGDQFTNSLKSIIFDIIIIYLIYYRLFWQIANLFYILKIHS